MVVGDGFEPSKAWPVDLQSTAFDRSATPPEELLLERVEGIEPSQLAWKANVLPLNYTRRHFQRGFITIHPKRRKSSRQHEKSPKKAKKGATGGESSMLLQDHENSKNVLPAACKTPPADVLLLS